VIALAIILVVRFCRELQSYNDQLKGRQLSIRHLPENTHFRQIDDWTPAGVDDHIFGTGDDTVCKA
jgi:hypothetical protein